MITRLAIIALATLGLLGCALVTDSREVLHEMKWSVKQLPNRNFRTLELEFKEFPGWVETVNSTEAVEHVESLNQATVLVRFEATHVWGRHRSHRILEIAGRPSKSRWGGSSGWRGDHAEPGPWR